MQFNLVLISAILVAVSPVLGADFVWHAGADCNGAVVARSPNVKAGDCVFLKNGGSAKSISFSGVPNHANFFESGGKHDKCTNGPSVVKKGPSGCANGPTGRILHSTPRFNCMAVRLPRTAYPLLLYDITHGPWLEAPQEPPP
ncbi:hypothetical protein FB45DRAFT_1085947 [Roridomyces roridus]|uniref:Uncharacterized protein n=1 Tax=Roridomyces roridus TaxID=1738132 RepID=A0AAD7BLL2_9AGAR|nr:hypothetical protein FB45DRAFT_1085947 [Roridomyces roridus]